MKRFLLAALAAMMVVCAVGCAFAATDDEVAEFVVNSIRNGRPTDYPGKTWSDVFDKLDGTFQCYRTEDDDGVFAVFEGKDPEDGVSVAMRFTVTDFNEDTGEIKYVLDGLMIDGEDYTGQIGAFMEGLFGDN